MKIYILFVLAINTAMAFIAFIKSPKKDRTKFLTYLIFLANAIAFWFLFTLCIFK